MKHIEYYEADDGTRFDDEWECEAYETNKRFPNIDEHLKGLDAHRKPIEIGAIDDESWQNKIMYYIIYDSIGHEYLGRCRDYTGIAHPVHWSKKTIYPRVIEYDGSSCGDDVVARFEKQKKIYDEIMSEV